MPTLATRATTPARVANRRDAPIARAFGDARFWRSDAQKMNALRHELETQRAETLRLHRERRIADDARAVAEERCAMYETRCERQEREIFALERQLEEKTSGVETAMSVARRQIKWQEERYDALARETEALRRQVRNARRVRSELKNVDQARGS